MMIENGVRAAVEAVGREVSRSVATAGDAGRGLQAAWDKLVEALALGPAPELRACPHCGDVGMRAATRCSACWAKLVPPAAEVRA